jgi:hypothetical protein
MAISLDGTTGISASGNITVGGTLTAGSFSPSSLSVPGNVTGGNLTTAGLITSTGNITGGNVLTGGLISATGTVTGSSHLGSVVSVTANITGGNLLTGGLISSTGTVTGSSLLGSVVSVTANVTGGNLLTAGQLVSTIANGTTPMVVTSTTKVVNLNVEQVDGYHADTANTVSTIAVRDAAANITAANYNGVGVSVTANITGGNLLTAGLVSATSTITSAANITGGNILTGGLVSAAGNITGGNVTATTGLTAGTLSLTGNTISSTDSIITIDPATVGTGGAVIIQGNLSVTGNMTYINSNNVTTNDLTINMANNAATAAAANGGGIEVGPVGTPYATITYNSTSNTWVVSNGANVSGTLSASGNVTGGNLLTGGLVSATGTITGSSYLGAVVSVTANITGGNILTGGLVSATGNILGATKILIGTGASTLTNPVAVFQGSGATYTQVATFNSTGTGSADLVAYGNNGDDTNSWADIGFTGNTFSDTNYTVTAAGDGYFFTQGNASFGGNMVIATGNVGTTKDIVFATGGFLTANIKARLYNSTGLFSAVGNIQGGNIITAGLISSTGNAIHSNVIVNGTAALGSGVLIVSGNIQTSAANATANIGNVSNYFNTIHGKSTTAQYADVAELYIADTIYEPGTVLDFGGVNEVTLSSVANSNRIAGVVSTNPAYLMNGMLRNETSVAVALTGRVPTSVTGTVRKGDMMVSAGNGVAQACATPAIGTVIGKALENFDGETGVIEVVIGRL